MLSEEFKRNLLKNQGMALTELILSLIFLVYFGLIIASTSSLLNKLLRTNNFNINNDYQSEIILVKKRMKEWVEIISQPSYSKEEINNMGCSYLPKSPKTIWNIPHRPVESPSRKYQFCVKKTSIYESEFKDLISMRDNAKPGIYILYAKPDIESYYLPFIRIIFCRPRVFCKA